MQTRNYLTEKEARKKSTRQGIVFISVFILIFVSVIARFAVRPGTNEGFFALVPTGDDAYKVAVDFVKPTTKTMEAAFPDNDFQYSKKSDSVYVVQSFYKAQDRKGADKKTNFAITLRYNGGSSTDDNNWTVEDLQYN
jgi:hypothetical protein